MLVLKTFVEMIISHCTSINTKTDKGYTPLSLAKEKTESGCWTSQETRRKRIMKPWNKPEKANEWRTKLEQIEDIEEWQVTPQKHPHFHAKIRTTDLQPERPLSRNLKKLCLHKLCNNSALQKSWDLRTDSMAVLAATYKKELTASQAASPLSTHVTMLLL